MSFSLGVEQGLQKLPKFDKNDLRLLFHCNILIPRKCPRKTLFKGQCPGSLGIVIITKFKEISDLEQFFKKKASENHEIKKLEIFK